MKSTLEYNRTKSTMASCESLNYKHNETQIDTENHQTKRPLLKQEPDDKLDDLFYVSSTRDCLTTEDFIPPKHW